MVLSRHTSWKHVYLHHVYIECQLNFWVPLYYNTPQQAHWKHVISHMVWNDVVFRLCACWGVTYSTTVLWCPQLRHTAPENNVISHHVYIECQLTPHFWHHCTIIYSPAGTQPWNVYIECHLTLTPLYYTIPSSAHNTSFHTMCI